jgi:alkylation response protein AidB-like acyl-CoA dehydrogenase
MLLSLPASGVSRQLNGLRPPGDPAEPHTTASWVRDALDRGLLDLPLPGGGRSADRFRALSEIARVDLDVARLAEAHVDAQAIIAELTGADQLLSGSEIGSRSRRLWGVWAANPPTSPLTATQSSSGWLIDGTKPWCSGAGCCDAALVTAHTVDGYRLFAVDLHDSSVRPVDGTWPARSMRGCDSRSVAFTATPASPLGGVDGYLNRPGFWHGAMGVAAVWLGGALAITDPLWTTARRRQLDHHALAHIGAIDAVLAAAEALLARAADLIDADPGNESGDAELAARQVRAVVESAAVQVVDRVGRALGAAPLALDAAHAKRVGDLELYLRQSHAERDLEAAGRLVVEKGGHR